jgi:hypothetical protein
MDPGLVRTMRGSIISMPELRSKSKRPIANNVDQKDKIQVKKTPAITNNIRGFVPSMDGVVMRSGSKRELNRRAEIAAIEEDKPTMADMTGVIVDKRPPQRPDDTMAAADEILKDIIGQIPPGRKLDDAPRRRSRQS